MLKISAQSAHVTASLRNTFSTNSTLSAVPLSHTKLTASESCINQPASVSCFPHVSFPPPQLSRLDRRRFYQGTSIFPPLFFLAGNRRAFSTAGDDEDVAFSSSSLDKIISSPSFFLPDIIRIKNTAAEASLGQRLPPLPFPLLLFFLGKCISVFSRRLVKSPFPSHSIRGVV